MGKFSSILKRKITYFLATSFSAFTIKKNSDIPLFHALWKLSPECSIFCAVCYIISWCHGGVILWCSLVQQKWIKMYFKKFDLQLTYTGNGKLHFSIHQLCCCCHWGNEWVTWRRTWSFKNVHWPHSGSHRLWFESTTLLLWYPWGILSAITGFQHWHDSSTICSKTTEIKSAHSIQLLFVGNKNNGLAIKRARRLRQEGCLQSF